MCLATRKMIIAATQSFLMTRRFPTTTVPRGVVAHSERLAKNKDLASNFWRAISQRGTTRSMYWTGQKDPDRRISLTLVRTIFFLDKCPKNLLLLFLFKILIASWLLYRRLMPLASFQTAPIHSSRYLIRHPLLQAPEPVPRRMHCQWCRIVYSSLSSLSSCCWGPGLGLQIQGSRNKVFTAMFWYQVYLFKFKWKFIPVMQFFDISVVLLSRQWGLVFEFEIVNHWVISWYQRLMEVQSFFFE